MGGVFDDGQVVAGSNLTDRIKVGGQPSNMHGNNGFRARCDGRFNLRWIKVEVCGADIYQHGFGVEIAHDLGRRSKGVRCCDHFVTTLQPGCFQDQVHGGRARVDGNGMFGADSGDKLRLELARLRAGRDPARGQGFFDVRKLGVVNIG